jgi:hypothetical protein
VKIDGGSEPPKIVRILRHDNPIFGDGARKDDTIWLAQPTAVARVNRVMKAQLVEMAAKRGRDALVDEKSHAALLARRETGRPTCGCVLP